MMKFGKKTLGLILSVGLLMGIGVGATPAHAYVEDAGVLDNFHTDLEERMWDYLNSHNYRFYNKRASDDCYITNDNTAFMAILNEKTIVPGNSGKLHYLIFLKPGPKTDLGIQVGDSVKKLIATYGEAHPTSEDNFIDNQPRMGYYLNSPNKKIQTRRGWEKVYQVTYLDRNNHHVDFMISRTSNRIMAIQYRVSGGKHVISDTYEAGNFIFHINNNGLGYYL
ncbi:hypothetical protein [Acidaminococcus fermentans]|nr:hypothetical protein [Acidaminococcus fermentans]